MVLLAFLGSTGASAVPEDQAPDVARIHALLREIEEATNTRDIQRLLRHATDGVVMLSKNGETLVGKAAVDAYVNRMLGAAGPALTGMHTRVIQDGAPIIHGAVAMAHGTSDDAYEFQGGMRLAIVTPWSATLVRQDGEWRIASLHFSFNLFDNPLLNAARFSVIVASGIGLVCGLLTGVLYMRWRVRFR
ncbi:MAG: nuclear transport factor 2 family protein [Polaromonas sp.]